MILISEYSFDRDKYMRMILIGRQCRFIAGVDWWGDPLDRNCYEID